MVDGASKKILFAVDKKSFNQENHIGVRKKVYSQIEHWKSLGHKVEMTEYEWENGYPTIFTEEDTDILYFRTIEPSVKLVKLLYGIKKYSRSIRIIMEVPTYPFDQEDEHKYSLKRRVNILLGKMLLRFVIDRVVIIGLDVNINSLYGIPVIHATNGINVEDIKITNRLIENNIINLIAVSGCYFWHGYERLIRGLGEYYNNESIKYEVNLHIVGSGNELPKYVEESTKVGLLDKHIFVHGRKEGSELDLIYDLADISINAIGAHRKGIFYDGSLKSRESLAKGIPMVTSMVPDILNSEIGQFLHTIPADESNVNINLICDFYEKIYLTNDAETVKLQIRNIASRYYSWNAVFRGVDEYIGAE